MDTNGSNVRRLTQNDYNDRTPAWSPDGLHIVFAADGEGNQELYVMDASGDNVQRLTSTALYDESYPKWRP
jgi:TolB protein